MRYVFWVSRILAGNRSLLRKSSLVIAFVCPVLACAPASVEPAQVSETNGTSVPASSPAEAGDMHLGDMEPGSVVKAAGKVVEVGQLGFGLVPDADPGTRFVPEELAEEFQQDGLRVVFRGVILESPRGVRQWGIPMRVESILTE